MGERPVCSGQHQLQQIPVVVRPDLLGYKCAVGTQQPEEFRRVKAAVPVENPIKTPVARGQPAAAIRLPEINAQRQ